MADPVVKMNDQEWAQLLYILWNAEGKGINTGLCHPLLMKIGEQLRLQSPIEKLRQQGNSQEMPGNIGEIGGVKQ